MSRSRLAADWIVSPVIFLLFPVLQVFAAVVPRG
jgi:hypothetical protein